MREIEKRVNEATVQEDRVEPSEPVVVSKDRVEPVDAVVCDTILEPVPDCVEKDEAEIETSSASIPSTLSSDNLPTTDKKFDLAAPAVMEAAKKSMDKARERVNDPKSIDKHAKDLADIANEMIENQLDEQRLANEKAAADNKVTRKNIANALYKARQEGIRLKKDAKHLSKMQKAKHRAEVEKFFWEAHKETLLQYGMHEGSPRYACEILLWLDGVKGFFNGLSKVSTALIKALRWVLIFGGIFAVLMVIPITRNWVLTLLGFIK